MPLSAKTGNMPHSARLSAYLQRLGLGAAPTADAAGLAALQAAHRQAITFENIDVLLGRGILIDTDAAFAKLVERGRGGYCFEQNRLYADMLSDLGIASRPLLARVRLGMAAGDIPPRSHVLLLADLAGTQWIADAGFGGSYVPPMPLEDGALAQTKDGAQHRLRHVAMPQGEWLLERAGAHAHTDGRAFDTADWQMQYSFDLAYVDQSDLAQANHWTATWPASRFCTVPAISRVLPQGFASLSATCLRMTSDNVKADTVIASAGQWRSVLDEIFGIRLADEEADALAGFLP